MKTKKIEVLAPAGNPAALKAAVFAARASAVNFSREEMREAVLFARERNVRVYVTVNTLLKDDELPEALDFCKFLCSVPVDGILIQDMGLFNILREACPEMPLHASTQMSLHTPGGAALLKELGASRVVLAREMSLKEIEEVSKRPMWSLKLLCTVRCACRFPVSAISAPCSAAAAATVGAVLKPAVCRLPRPVARGTTSV